MRLRWLTQALADLREIHGYIAKDNPEAVRHVIGEIRREVEILATQPRCGRPGRLSGSREFVVPKYPYIVACCVKEDAGTTSAGCAYLTALAETDAWSAINMKLIASFCYVLGGYCESGALGNAAALLHQEAAGHPETRPELGERSREAVEKELNVSNIGSSFDDFLKKEATLQGATAVRSSG
jgi:plasmid stabilization system protein ParE